MKKIGIIAIVLLLLAASGAVVGYRLLVSGAGGLDDWVARKVVAIAEVYLVPDVEFDSFQYKGGALTLGGVTLVAPGGTRVVDAATLRVEFAAIPTPATGVAIQRVEINDARLHLIRSADGGFEGLVPFVERENVRNQDQIEQDMRLSKAFQIRHIALNNCSIVYEAGDGRPPMELSGITLAMDIQPDQDNAGDRVYALDTNLDRSPVLSLGVKGRLNLDALSLDLDSLSLKADLAQEQAVDALPPQLQTLVREHDVTGILDVGASGRVALRTPLDSSLSVDVGLSGFNVAAGDYRLPIDSGTVKIDLADRIALLNTAQIQSCQGVIDAGGSQINFNDDAIRAGVQWTVSGFRLRDLLRASTEGEPPKFAGVVASSGTADVASVEPLSLSGTGNVTVREGRLVNLPLISGLARAMNILGKISSNPKFNDKADVEFTLTDTAAKIDTLDVETEILVARGDGTVGYDGALDLLLNAGPLEKIQKATGIVGDIVGAVTDQVVKYDVEGTVGDPEIKVRPLGIGG